MRGSTDTKFLHSESPLSLRLCACFSWREDNDTILKHFLGGEKEGLAHFFHQLLETDCKLVFV